MGRFEVDSKRCRERFNSGTGTLGTDDFEKCFASEIVELPADVPPGKKSR